MAKNKNNARTSSANAATVKANPGFGLTLGDIAPPAMREALADMRADGLLSTPVKDKAAVAKATSRIKARSSLSIPSTRKVLKEGLKVIEARLAEVEARMARVEASVESHGSRLGSVEASVSDHGTRLGAVEGRLDRHAKNGEGLDARIAAVEDAYKRGVESIDARIAALEAAPAPAATAPAATSRISRSAEANAILAGLQARQAELEAELAADLAKIEEDGRKALKKARREAARRREERQEEIMELAAARGATTGGAAVTGFLLAGPLGAMAGGLLGFGFSQMLD